MADPGLNLHAALWTGTPESYIDMNPAGAHESKINAMAPGVQAGYALIGTSFRGVLWRGSPDEYVDLTPLAASNALLYATTGTIHAGSVTLGSGPSAAVWLGDNPEDFIDLHQYLGPGWDLSVAKAVAVHDGYIYVAGLAYPSGAGARAVVWISPIPAPATALPLAGLLLLASNSRRRR